MKWIDKLELIDKDAADWIRREGSDKVDASELYVAFVWSHTPQGYKYWAVLHEKIENFKEEPVSRRHKHADLIIAWAEGAEIEFKDGVGQWCGAQHPLWYEDYEYRIKPKTRIGNVRVAVLTDSDKNEYLGTFHLNFEEVERGNNFVRWVTDIIEVELKGE